MIFTVIREHIQVQEVMNRGFENGRKHIPLGVETREIEGEGISSVINMCRLRSDELFGTSVLTNPVTRQDGSLLVYKQEDFITFTVIKVDGVVCNRFMLQKNRISLEEPVSLDWFRNSDGWLTSYGYNGYLIFYDLNKALSKLKDLSDNSSSIWPLRIVDSYGEVYLGYDPERDMRLPGCRDRMIVRNAKYLCALEGHSEWQYFLHEAEEAANIDIGNEGIVEIVKGVYYDN